MKEADTSGLTVSKFFGIFSLEALTPESRPRWLKEDGVVVASPVRLKDVLALTPESSRWPEKDEGVSVPPVREKTVLRFFTIKTRVQGVKPAPYIVPQKG